MESLLPRICCLFTEIIFYDNRADLVKIGKPDQYTLNPSLEEIGGFHVNVGNLTLVPGF